MSVFSFFLSIKMINCVIFPTLAEMASGVANIIGAPRQRSASCMRIVTKEDPMRTKDDIVLTRKQLITGNWIPYSENKPFLQRCCNLGLVGGLSSTYPDEDYVFIDTQLRTIHANSSLEDTKAGLVQIHKGNNFCYYS